jgi:ubiquinone/menaquinone biosynthesis C-methylase UbiE
VNGGQQKEATPSVGAGSPERFGYQWSIYSGMLPEYEEQFRKWTAHLRPEDWKGLTFLDVGCGTGRNSFWAMAYGAAGGVAVDVDQNSLLAARRMLQTYPTVAVNERSAYALGYEDQFDIVFSIGVIHHLEFPDKALAEMRRATKPQGKVLIWVYGLENTRWIVRLIDTPRRLLFSRLPITFVHHLSLYPAMLLWTVLRLGFGKTEYWKFLRNTTFRHLRLIIFDQMLPKIANYWPRETVERLMREAGLHDVKLIWVNEVSWSAIGTKLPSEGSDVPE